MVPDGPTAATLVKSELGDTEPGSINIDVIGIGSSTFDPFWMMITKQSTWIPFFLILLYFVFKKIGPKKGAILVLFVFLLIVVNDQTTNIIRVIFKRLRPCNDPSVNQIIRIFFDPIKKEFYKPIQYSFVSGHASNSMATMLFFFLIDEKTL